MTEHGWTDTDDRGTTARRAGWDTGDDVRHVQPYEAAKPYRCPGCDHEIRPGEGHEVVVPHADPRRAPALAHRLLAAASSAAGVAERR